MLLLPTKYDYRHPTSPNQEIEPDKFVEIQLRLSGRYGGLTILQPYQPPFVEGWWQSGGALHPPEVNRLINIVTGPLSDQAARQAEVDWLVKELYPTLKTLLEQEEIFLLIQDVERVFEDQPASPT